jgi:CRP/FNR family transcriptional regulator, cyclic AMP receptor protein
MSVHVRPVATVDACRLAQTSEQGSGHAAALFGKRGWLSHQPPAFRHRILSMARPVQATRGAWIFAVNDPPGGIYGIVSGGIGIEGIGPYNLPRLGHVLRSGDWFGHSPILSGGGNRVQGMRALEDSELVYVPLAPLRALITEDPVAARCVGQMADGGSILATRVISDLLIPSVPQRIAAVLLRVTGAEHGIEPHHPDGFLVTQTDLGEMANVSRSNVNRVLGDFARQGWITKHYQRLRVRDVAALQAFAASQV